MSWERTELWKLILQRRTQEGRAIRLLLEKWLPQIEKILLYGGTAPLDFTLHDSAHAQRVAVRMTQLIPSDVVSGLSTYELALLLLAAYLHDIGMTPEQRKVFNHFQFLVAGNRELLTASEAQQFQEFIDDHAEELPLAQGTPTPADLKRASRLIMYYARHKHNDWSEEWIRKHLSGESMGAYSGWVEDLVLLCRSHHEAYGALVRDRFNPRIVGSPAAVVHLRYLAVILRVADILEFDPERTPEIVLRHRDISPSSLLYWYKDHEISMVFEDNRVVLAARPSNARMHRAIEVMADDIDKELSTARALADETHFDKCPGLNKTLKHRWDLMPSVHRQIEPRDPRYEYIDGAFRPNTSKLLELLSGVELYGSHLDAIRELVQNALDAIRIQIALERLERREEKEKEKDLAVLLGRLHTIELNLETTPDGPCLTCQDSGVGMSKAIIRDRLLVSGTGQTRDVRDLERKCKEAGFTLGVTGQFGIGVLSYFMLADRVVLRTRRAVLGGDSEDSGWVFETEGVGSFGELQRDTSITQGTSVQLYLRPEVVGKGLREFYESVRSYLLNSLHWIPCRFRLRSTVPGCAELSLQPGWTWGKERLTSLVLGQVSKRKISSTMDDLLSLAQKQQAEKEKAHWKTVNEEASKCLRWVFEEGDLPWGLGKYRIAMPYFELLGEKVLAFMRVTDSEGKILARQHRKRVHSRK